MVLDILLFRNSPDVVRESQRRRFADVTLVDQVIDLDNRQRELNHKLSLVNRDFGLINKQVAQKKKAGENADDLIAQTVSLRESEEKLKSEIVEVKKTLDETLPKIGNIVHDSVPVSETEDDNAIITKWGELRTLASESALLKHWELLPMVDGVDMERGASVSGHRGYFLRGFGVRLNLAIIQYGIDFLESRGYTALSTPFLMKKEPMSETAQLSQFDEELYKTVVGDEEKYLIATSEQPISAYHRGEWLNPKELPYRYAGISTCFRKEAGAYGKDVKGIFRVHQFEKVEQFCITRPEDSWEMHEAMLRASEEFYQSLKLPYRVVAIVSKELNNAAAKKYDLEGWFPGSGEYRELVSCSNCTDYQSRSLEVRCGTKQKGEKEKKYVHMLNSTLAATTRTICCILENYQREGGVEIPEVLRPYLGGKSFIPFVKEVPKEKGKPADKKEAKKADSTKTA